MSENQDGTAGGVWVTVAMSGLPVRSVRCCRLRITRGPDRGKSAFIDQPSFRVGALPSNDLQLTDPAVSGHHLEFLLEPDGYRVRDLGSRNGTLIGDVRIVDAYLPRKVRIDIGDTQVTFEVATESIEVPASTAERYGPLLGRSVVMRELFAQLEKVARSQAAVLITGETGTGKEAVAEAVVAGSDRADGPVVIVDCGALAPTLVEAELFGFERGAFTGAVAAQAGAFERAHGGTVLLDEIGELPLALQPKLLRVLERHEVRRLGGSTAKHVDIRVLAATHRALEEEVNRGTFRADLFYRLSVLTVRVPPLRNRREDIPLLAEHFLSQIPDTAPAVLAAEIIEHLKQHSWPGNVRELRNAVERLALGAEPLAPGQVQATGASVPPPGGAGPVDLTVPFPVQKDRLVRDFERRYAQALLEFSPKNLARAARTAGMDRMAVVKLLQRHGLLQVEREEP